MTAEPATTSEIEFAEPATKSIPVQPDDRIASIVSPQTGARNSAKSRMATRETRSSAAAAPTAMPLKRQKPITVRDSA